MATIERLQYITHGSTLSEILSHTTAYLLGGGRWVQLRMKESSTEEFMEAAIHLRELCNRYGATLLINDNVEVCKAVGGDGVHLGQQDMEPRKARELLGEGKIIGLTCNTAEQILEASTLGVVDYLGVGPLRYTTTKQKLSPIIGMEGYGALAALTSIAMVAVGGVTMADIRPLQELGVWGIALSGVITRAGDPTATTQQLLEEIGRYLPTK